MLTKSRRIRIAEHVVRTVKINVCNVLVGEAKGKRQFGKHGYEWENNIKMDLQEKWLGLCNVYQGHNKNKNILLWKRSWIFEFHQMREIYLLAEQPVVSCTQLCSMEWNSLVQKDIWVSYVFSVHCNSLWSW